MEGWAPTRRGSLLENRVPRVGAYSRGRVIEGLWYINTQIGTLM